MPITFLDEEEDIKPIVPPTKRKITFLDEEDDEVTQPAPSFIPYQYDKSRFLPKAKTTEEQEIGTIEGIVNSAKNAFDSSRQAMDVIGGVTPEEAKNISKIEYDKQSRKLAPGYDEYQKAEGMDAVWAFAKNPIEVTSNIIAEGLAGSLPALGAGLAAGGVGAAAGSVVPGLGTAAGFTAGQVAGTFAGSLATEYGGKILEELQNEGMDIQDPESINKFFANQTLVDAAKDKALKRGVPIAAFDAISAGIGGKLGRVIGKQFVTKTGEAAAELGVQAALGGGGEVAGALAAGEPIEGKAVFGEIIGEAGPGAAEIITGRMADRAARVKAEEDAKIKAAAELSTNLEESNAPLTAAAVKSTTATTIEQDKLAAQLEEQLDAEELVAVKEPTAAPPTAIPTKDDYVARYSAIAQVAPEELTRAEQSFTNELATADTEEKRTNAQNALDAIKEVKATRVAAPEAKPAKAGKLPTDVLPVETPGATYGREEGIYDVFAGVRRKPLEPTQPAAEAAQPTPTYAAKEIIQPEGVRPEPQARTEIEAQEAGVSDSLQPPARGEEEGQVIFGLRSVADNTATREQISALSEAGLVDIVKGKPVINEDGAAILAQAEAPAIVEQEPVTTPAPEEAVTPAPVVSEEGAQVSEITPAPTIREKPQVSPMIGEAAPEVAAVDRYTELSRNPKLGTAKERKELEPTVATTTFKTSRGSTYYILPDGKIRRDKYSGTTSYSDQIAFVSPENAEKIKNIRSEYQEGKNASVEITPEVIRFRFNEKTEEVPVASQSPQDGLSPFELSGGRYPHLGDPVVSPAPVTEQAAPAEAPAPEVAPIQRDVENREQMTPEEASVQRRSNEKNIVLEDGAGNYISKTSKGYEVYRLEATNPKRVATFGLQPQYLERAKQRLAELSKESHSKQVALAAINNRPVSASAVESYGINLPEGYTKQGDLYVYQPTPAVSETITEPAAATAQAELAETVSVSKENFTPPIALPDSNNVLPRSVVSEAVRRSGNPPPIKPNFVRLYRAEPSNMEVRVEDPRKLTGVWWTNSYELASEYGDRIYYADFPKDEVSLGNDGIVIDKKGKGLSGLGAKLYEPGYFDLGLNKKSAQQVYGLIMDGRLEEASKLIDTESSQQQAEAPTGIAVGNRVRLGKSPQTYIVEEVIPQSESEKANNEQSYSIRNEKTGEILISGQKGMKVVGGKKRRMAAEPEPLPENERYGQVKLNRRIQKYFGGKIPDKVYVVDNTDNKEYQYKAAYYPDLGILVVNNAYVRKGENVGDIIAHELGHYAFGDKKFKDAFDNFYNSLSQEDKAKIDNIIEDSYNEETEESKIEERNVIAFTAYTIVNPQRRSLWNAVLDALKAFANKVFGKNFQMSDPNRTALAMLATAKRRFAAGEEIVREDIQARKMAAQTQDARFAELESRAKAGDKEAEAEAQRMVDEAARGAGYTFGPVYHGTKEQFTEFKPTRYEDGLSFFSLDEEFSRRWAKNRAPSASVEAKIKQVENESRAFINQLFDQNPQAAENTDEGLAVAQRLFDQQKEFERSRLDGLTAIEARREVGVRVIKAYLRTNEVFDPKNWREFAPQIFNQLNVNSEAEINPQVLKAIEGGNYIIWENKQLVDAVLSKYGAMLIQENQGQPAETIAIRDPERVKSADPFTYDDAGNLIPLSERFQPTTPDIRRMAVEAEPRREQVAGRTDRGTDIITTPVGIIKQTNEVLRKNFFDGTTVSDEATKKAWEYIERSLDIESGKATELAGQINNLVDAETNSKARMGASLFHVSLANYAAKLAALGDDTMLSFLVRRINKMPLDNRPGAMSDYARGLRGAREYDIDGYGALKVEQQAKRDRTAAEIFARGNPTEQQVKDVSAAIDAADNATIGTPEEVASDVEKIEKRTKRNITKKLETLLKKGSLKEMIASIKNTPLEEQQTPGWIEKVIKGYLEQAGLTGDAATTAAKLYDSILTERFVAAKQKAFEETLGRSAPWNNYLSRNSRMAKDSLKKIQVAIRTGVLDPSQTIESVIAKENGWDGFTKEQFEKIVQLDNIINNPDNDDVTRREAMSELNKVIVDAKLPVRFKDALGAYYVGNALMGIPTVTVNIASPIGFTVRNLMTDIGRYAFTDPARIPIAFESFLDSMRSWYDQTSYAFKNQIYLNDVVEYLQGQNVLRELFDKGKKQWANGEYAAGFVNMAVGMTQITGRVLSSLDQGAIAMLENQNITRYAMEALAGNTKGRVPKDKLKEFANMVLHTKRRVIAESIASGMPRDRAGVLADLAVKSEVIAALSSQNANPMAVLDASINDALLSVGRNKAITIKGAEKENTNLSDEGMLSYLPISFLQTIASGAARQGSAMQIFSKMLYGFALVPARVFHNVAWFSPYGFIRLGVDKYKKSKGQDSPYAMSLQTEAQFKQRLTEAIAGSVVMLGLAALRAGSSDDEDDKKFRIVITGNGPSATTDRQYYDSWNKKWKPYSIHIVVGDTIIPINIGRGGEALFFPIMLAGAMDDWEIKKKQNATKKEPEDLSAMASMLGSSFFALAQRGPYAAFTKPLFDASKQGRVTEELASQAGYFGKTFIPLLGTSAARNITDFINDPVDRSSIQGAIYANTPIVGPWMGAKALNALGQPVRADDWGDRLFKLGVPVVFSFPKDTPMNELNELILKQGSGPTIPTRTNAQKRLGDILTDDEFETYVREYGKVMSDRMFKNRTKLARMKPSDYDDELEKYARGYSAGDFKIKGASDSAVQAVKRMRQ